MIIMFILKRPVQQMADIPYKKWQCSACGLIYDEELGDEEEGFPPGTRFKDIDDNWICPDCGATKDIFEEVKK